MTVKYLCPFWGMEGLSADEFIDKVLKYEYDGIEINIPNDSDFENKLLSRIKDENLIFVAQQWLSPKLETVNEYIVRLEDLLLKRASLNPDFINSHTGKDYFSFEDNCRIIEKCFEISKRTGVEIIHETHRGRFNYSAKKTVDFLKQYPDLKLTADFSHWVTVSESFLEDQMDDVQTAVKKCYYIHARVGYTQSPQINNPFAPENKEALEIFTNWWKSILQDAKIRGQKEFYICPEFGPKPYMPYLPFKNVPIENQWNLNKQMMLYLKNIDLS
ncbi:sugar phosphate isomerase/epimerase family protein [Namhaeicola litoreus]|uniref:Sugar phosphate isomerase/epimerase family protein n=1 Tax=Namhaeicola litoreus TaxID=1052145 RepID=A0ABW3Y165_9FLAO